MAEADIPDEVKRLPGDSIGGVSVHSQIRPVGITVLSIFFWAATAITLIAAVSLLFPDGFLEPIWRLNPRGRATLGAFGMWAVLLFFVVVSACAVAALGLWQKRWWGYFTGIGVLSLNLLGDPVNVVSGNEPRAIIGVPIAALIIIYLLRPKVRKFFNSPSSS